MHITFYGTFSNPLRQFYFISRCVFLIYLHKRMESKTHKTFDYFPSFITQRKNMNLVLSFGYLCPLDYFHSFLLYFRAYPLLDLTDPPHLTGFCSWTRRTGLVAQSGDQNHTLGQPSTYQISRFQAQIFPFRDHSNIRTKV